MPAAPEWSPYTVYSSALTNHLIGGDVDENTSEIRITLNSSFGSWYYGTDANPAGNQWDFATVALHEIGHGLNFFGAIQSSGAWTFGIPGIFDRFLELDPTGDGTDLTEMDDAGRFAAIRGSNLFWNGVNGTAGNGGSKIKMYAPSTFSPGSSVSHIDLSLGDSVMTPSLVNGVAKHDPTNREMGMLTDMGWNTGSGGFLLAGAFGGNGGGNAGPGSGPVRLDVDDAFSQSGDHFIPGANEVATRTTLPSVLLPGDDSGGPRTEPIIRRQEFSGSGLTGIQRPAWVSTSTDDFYPTGPLGPRVPAAASDDVENRTHVFASFDEHPTHASLADDLEALNRLELLTGDLALDLARLRVDRS